MGLVPQRVGKTWVVSGLLAGLRERGVRCCGLKPLSSHDWYMDYGTTALSLREGLPLSGDVLELREAAGADEPLCVLNPVHLVLAPPDPAAFVELRVPGMYYVYVRSLDKRVLASRVTLLEAGSPALLGYLNEGASRRGVMAVGPGEVARALRRVDSLRRVGSAREVLRATEELAPRAIGGALDLLSGRYRVLVVEGYLDHAWTLPPREPVDLVVAVAPGSLLVYDPARYAGAISVRAQGRLGGHVTLSDVFPLLTPVRSFRLEPMGGLEPPETKAERVGELVDLVVALLEGSWGP